MTSEKRLPRDYRHPRTDTPPDAAWLREQIEKRGMTHVSIAEGLKLDQSKFSRILSGERKIEIPEFVELAALLDIPLAQLLKKLGYATAARRIEGLKIK